MDTFFANSSSEFSYAAPRPLVDIIIVNWNSGVQLNQCVDSIIDYGFPLVDRIIVVDNGSTDGSESAVEALQSVTLVRAGVNLGFGAACNLGATHANSEFLLFLNPDARLFFDTLAKALNFLHRPDNERVGICGVQLVDEEGCIARSCARFPTVSGLVARAIGFDHFIPKLGPTMSEWNHRQTREVDQVIGAFFIVRANIFEMLCGFDERFFVYFEEVDFSRRAWEKGWSSAYLADAQAFHLGGGTSRQVKAKRLFYSLRSRVLYAFKHFSLVGAIVVLLTTLFIEPMSRLVQAVGRFSWVSLRETLSAYRMLFCWIPSWIFRGVVR